MIIIKRLKLIFQENLYDCGISCLLTILRYYKCNVPKIYLEQLSLTTKEGTTMYNLMKAALTLGFKSYGKKGDITDISPKLTPFIAHIKIDEKRNIYHYVIVSKITTKKIIIKDPGSGSKELSLEEFNKISTGNYLFIEDTIKVKKFNTRNILKEICLRFFIVNKKTLILILIATTLTIILELLNLFSLKIILNNAILVESLTNLYILIITFCILLLLKTALSFITTLHLNKLSSKLSYKFKMTLIKQLLTLPNIYYQTKEKGFIVSLFNDIDILIDYLLSTFTTLVNSVSIVIFIYILFLSLSIEAVLILLVSSIILLAFIFCQNKYSKNIFSLYFKSKDKVNNFINKIINRIERIKGLNLNQTIEKNFSKVSVNFTSTVYNLNRYKEIISNSLKIIENIIYFLIIAISGVLLIKKDLSLPTFLLIESLIFIALRNTESLILLILKHQEYIRVKERLNDIFMVKKEVLLPFPKYNCNKNLAITIKNLSFKYDENLVLNNINLKINPKDKVFIYGPSGSGKSTLVKMLARLIPVKYNHIKVGNIDITHYNLADLRNIITYIPNDEMLNKTDIKNNIYLGRKPHINQDKLLEMTGLKKLFKDKKYNINTILDEDGENLSKGERNRISLAQALFKPSEIYILDECLSNVDISLEKEILENILNYYQDKIIIYISHRLTNKSLFNRVFVMKEGKCYEELQ